MYRVSGKVLVKETGAGVADLQVVLYDVDASRPGEPGQKVAKSAAAELYANQNAANPAVSWQGFPGDRLGSVLTDRQGRFELTFDEAAFQADEPGKRPDLVLLLVAPEDTQQGPKGEALPYPARTAERILHISHDVVANAGRNEEYVIRLGSALLERHSIEPRDRTAEAATAQQFVGALEQARHVAGVVFESERQAVKTRFEKNQHLAGAARSFAAGFSATPASFRASPLFAGEAKARESERNQAAATAEAKNAGLKLLASYKERSNPKVLVHLTAEQVAALEARGVLSVDAAASGQFWVASVCSLLSGRVGDVSLERVRGLLADIQSAAPPTSPPPPPGSGSPAPGAGANPAEDPPADLPPEEAVRQRVLGQIHHLETPQLGGSSKGVMDTLLEMLKQMKSQEQGPSDVAAIRDFHSLQIAFPHVWSEAFDARLRAGVETLYADTVRLHEDHGVPPPALESLRDVNDLRRFLSEASGTRHVPVRQVPEAIASFFPTLTSTQWNSLTTSQQLVLVGLVMGVGSHAGDAETRRQRGLDVINNPQGGLGRIERLILELEESLAEPYAFHYFAPSSVNFGLMVTYRQEWIPETYQVGDLVATIPLAPGETRKFTKQQTTKASRAQKEIEKSMSSRQEEFQQSRRAEDEILNRAQVSTNFQMTAQGSLSFGIGEIGGSTQFALNQAQESSRVKKSFHEAVMKAAYEYKSERSLEVETTSERELGATASGELSNPNNELTVTYLLYELERRYKVSEKLQRLTPVIMVAQDIPAPQEIDDDWLLAHEWILRRVLLDDSFHSALTYLSQDFVRNEVSLQVKQANWKQQKQLVTKLESQLERLLATRDGLRDTLANLTQREHVATAGAPDDVQRGFVNMLTGGFSEIAGAFGGATEGEKLEGERKVAEMRLEHLQEALADAQSKLSPAAEALNQATQQYTRALEEQASKRTAIDQLRVHVKQNILYYSQAIWDHEPPDQRFFRLYHVEVELPGPGAQACRMRRATEAEVARGLPGLVRDGTPYVIECGPPMAPSPSTRQTKTLAQLADLDRPLGFKGNYILFPLKECTYLTDFMMQEYIDDYFGVRDPDEGSNYTTEELLKYAEGIRSDLSDEQRRALDQLIAQRLTQPRRESETIVVPTGQLFIEALLGSRSLLEPFKMLHRGLDVAKIEAEVREMNLENLRRASRLIADEREDPEIDKKILVVGSPGSGVIVPPEA